MDRGAWRAKVHGNAELDTTELPLARFLLYVTAVKLYEEMSAGDFREQFLWGESPAPVLTVQARVRVTFSGHTG